MTKKILLDRHVEEENPLTLTCYVTLSDIWTMSITIWMELKKKNTKDNNLEVGIERERGHLTFL